MSDFAKMNNQLKPREKMYKLGAKTLSNAELLAIILQSGSKQESVVVLAQKIIEKHHGLTKLLASEIDQLIEVNGIGVAKASKIKAMAEIIWRINQEMILDTKSITNPSDVYELTKEYATKNQEHLIVLCLDGVTNLIYQEVIFVGTNNEILINPKEIFHIALKKLSHTIILVHNHPSGNPKPSKMDLESTKRLLKMSKLVGIDFLDHVIISRAQYCSLKENYAIIFKEVEDEQKNF